MVCSGCPRLLHLSLLVSSTQRWPWEKQGIVTTTAATNNFIKNNSKSKNTCDRDLFGKIPVAQPFYVTLPSKCFCKYLKFVQTFQFAYKFPNLRNAIYLRWMTCLA